MRSIEEIEKDIKTVEGWNEQQHEENKNDGAYHLFQTSHLRAELKELLERK